MSVTYEQHMAHIEAQAAECDAYVAWCADRDLDPSTDHWDEFRAAASDAHDAYLESKAEDMALERSGR